MAEGVKIKFLVEVFGEELTNLKEKLRLDDSRVDGESSVDLDDSYGSLNSSNSQLEENPVSRDGQLGNSSVSPPTQKMRYSPLVPKKVTS